jgi:hypothetical protein
MTGVLLAKDKKKEKQKNVQDRWPEERETFVRHQEHAKAPKSV